MDNNLSFSVFTKPWKNISTEKLAKFVQDLGFDGIEFTLREGYQVQPKNAIAKLPELVNIFKDHGISVTSVASTTDEHIFEACAKADVPMIRTMAVVDLSKGYFEWEKEKRQELEQTQLLCEKYNVKTAIQMHYGLMVSNSMELRHLLEGFNPNYIGGIWDAAHSGLAGEVPEQGLDIIWDYLMMINLKNAFYMLRKSDDPRCANWQRYFTLGSNGLSKWPLITDYLTRKNYKGTICLTAEYSDEERVDEYIKRDLAYVKDLFGIKTKVNDD